MVRLIVYVQALYIVRNASEDIEPYYMNNTNDVKSYFTSGTPCHTLEPNVVM